MAIYRSRTSTRRILCLHIPRFAAIAAKASEDLPRAIIEQQRQMMIVHSVNKNAQDTGVVAGMALSDARAFAPDLRTAPLDPALIKNAAERLAMWLDRYSPLVGHEPLGDPLCTGGGIGFWIDISGVAHLFGGEQALLKDLVARLTSMGLPGAQTAIAPTPGAAWAVAHFSPDASEKNSVSAKNIRSTLYPMPPAALRLEDKTLEALERLGLRRIADIVKLPRAELGQRFPRDAQSLLQRLDQALGDTAESITPLMPPCPYASRQLYPEPVQHKEAVQMGLVAGLKVVVKALERDQRGARQIDLRLFRVDGHCQVISINTNAPSRNVQGLARLFDDRFEGLDVGFGLDGVTVQVTRHGPLAYEQTSMLNAHGRTTRGAVFDRIANKFGAHAVRQLRVAASHTPGADTLAHPLGFKTDRDTIPWRRGHRDRVLVGRDQDAPAQDQGRAATRNGKLLALGDRPRPGLALVGAAPRPIHLFPRPEAVPLRRHGKSQARMTWRRVSHRLIRLEGPERITPDWWRATTTSEPDTHDTHDAHDAHDAHGGLDAAGARPRDYYRGMDDQGRGFYLFETLSHEHQPTGQWHVAGMM